MIRLDTDPIDSAGLECRGDLRDQAKAERALITHVGQELFQACGEKVRIVDQDDAGEDEYRWLALGQAGIRYWYTSAGRELVENTRHLRNLVGPAPDVEELAQLKADNARLIAENKALKRASSLSQAEFDELARDAECVISRDDLCNAIRSEAMKYDRVLRSGDAVYLLIELPEAEVVGLDGGTIIDAIGSRIVSPDGKAVLYAVREK